MLPSYQEIVVMLQQSYKYPFNDVFLRTFVFFAFFWILRYFSAAQVRYFYSKKRLDGKIAIITGANCGLGKEMSKDLAKRGCTVILACRNLEAAEAAKAEIVVDSKSKGTTAKIQVLPLDVSSFKSIKAFVTQFGLQYERLDILIHNAGYLNFFKDRNDNTNSRNIQSQSTECIDLTMLTNFYGPFLLTCLLLDKMKQTTTSYQQLELKPTTSSNLLTSAALTNVSPARVIYVTSNFYSYAKLESVLYSKCSIMKSIPLYKYFQSKCAAIAISQEFTDRLKNMRNNGNSSRDSLNREVTFNCVCPGSVNTNLFRNVPTGLDKIYSMIRKYFFKTPNEGVQTLMYAAISDELEGVSGKYFIDNREEKLQEYVKDAELRRRLWDHTVKIVNL